MSSWDHYISVIKDLSTIVTIILGIIAIIIHWKTFFRPHSKKLEENEFNDLISLYKALLSYKFSYIYNNKYNNIDLGLLKEITDPLVLSSASPFLPVNIRDSMFSFIKNLFFDTNLYLTMTGVKLDKVAILNKEGIYKGHEDLVNKIEGYLKIKNKTLPFKLS